MKKFLIFLIVVVQVFLFAEDGTELEKIWQKAVTCNSDVQAAACNKRIAENALAYFWQKRIPSVSFSASSSFLQNEEEFVKEPQKIASSVLLQEALPGGFTVCIEPSVVLSKGADENSGIVYSDVESIGVSVSQSLNPYWLQKSWMKKSGNEKSLWRGNCYGEKKKSEPEELSLELEYKLCGAELDEAVFTCLENVTDYFIRYRQCSRKLDSIKKTVDLYRELVEAWEELLCSGKSSEADVYAAKENLYSYEEDLYECRFEKENYGIQLQRLIGMESLQAVDGRGNDGKLVIGDAIYLSELPEIGERRFVENPGIVYLRLLKERAKCEYTIGKQNSGPVLSLGGTFPVHEKERDYLSKFLGGGSTKNWSVSLGLDFSPLFKMNQNYLRKNYETTVNEYERRILFEEARLRNERIYYEELIAACKKQLEMMNAVRGNKKEILEATELLYERGGCSRVDLLNARINFWIKENDYYVQQDSLWFYEWMKMNREG
ncbi:MAG: hypothetical protein K6A43_04410 [Treponema sp.]|nr:hypothetical protein [Treponema sp.]